MSLTSFLKKSDVREDFRQHFKVPKITTEKKLLAPPLSKRYALVGTAFDYLLRFYLQRRNKNAVHQRWVAAEGLKILEDREQKGIWTYDLDNDELHMPPNDPLATRARAIFSEAQTVHAMYLSRGRLTDDLLKITLQLAQLDAVYRSGYVDENIGTTYKEDIEDLRKLISLVKPKLFRAKYLCLLNPTFGKASALVGGADADLLIDDMLIDIKTTKNLVLMPDYYYQIIGYFILNRLSAAGNLKPRPKIQKLGIYFSRHGHLEVFEVRDIINSKRFSQFVKWFAERAH